MKLVGYLSTFLLSTALGAKVQYHRADALEVVTCLPGWVKNTSTNKCDDVDECAAKTHTCRLNECKNTPGSFQCLCGKGYTGTLPACVDIDECKIGNHTCYNGAAGVTCQNTKGSFQCACNAGWEGLHYVGANNTPYCSNQNECLNANVSKCHAQASCNDTHGSYVCLCNAGWSGNGTSCYDVNECDKNSCHWKHGSVCANTVGSYTCNCRAGFKDDGNGKCENVNECTTTPVQSNCNSLSTCIDTDGSFWCKCNAGYWGDGVNCSDIDECQNPKACAAVSPLAHSSQCRNTVGSFKCDCQAGWVADAQENCLNVNECANSTLNKCASESSTCTDTMGSFFCTCKTGWRYNLTTHTCSDIDECNTTLHGCFNQGQGCLNTNGSWACNCKPGYAVGSNTTGWTNSSVFCGDVNECTAGTHNCHAQGKCTDAFGSFSCACNNGYIGDGVNCEAYDACLFKHDDCDKNAACATTAGSFTCTCNTGYSGNGTNCSDIDECGYLPNGTINTTARTDNCNTALGVCANSIGSFICVCKDGYLGNGLDCLDINECEAGLAECPGNSTCQDTAGSFKCVANTGYEFVNVTYTIPVVDSKLSLLSTESHSDSDSKQWPSVGLVVRETGIDIDECAKNAAARAQNASVPLLCHANATCNNTVGSYLCLCMAGWAPTGDGKNCADIDECKVGPSKCSVHAYCHNTLGNYTCQCKPGYKGDGYVCEDIDECAEAALNTTANRSMCNLGANCSNTVGSFACACLPGYFGDGINCLNKDECKLKIHNCKADYLCTDTLGSFTCQCPTGYANMNLKANGTVCMSNKTVEVGQFQMKKLTWQTVYFTSKFFVTPVVVVQLPVAAGDRQVAARIRHVTTKSFQVTIAYEITPNMTEDQAFFKWLNASLPPINFIAATPGNTTLPDGTIVNAGLKYTLNQNARSTPCVTQAKRFWETVTFARNFSTNPVILASFQNTDEKLFYGGEMANFCEPGLRFDPAKNNTFQIARICHLDSQASTTYRGYEVVGWIAIGSNNSVAATRSTSFYVLNNEQDGNKTITYAMAESMSAAFTDSWGHTNVTSKEKTISYGSTFSSPITFASKISLDLDVVGWMNLEGAFTDNAVVRVKDDKCALPQTRKEYFTAFVANQTFSV